MHCTKVVVPELWLGLGFDFFGVRVYIHINNDNKLFITLLNILDFFFGVDYFGWRGWHSETAQSTRMG